MTATRAQAISFTLTDGEFARGSAVYHVSFMPAVRSYAGIPLGLDGSGGKFVLDVTTPPPTPVSVKGISLDAGWRFLNMGGTAQAVAEVAPANAVNKGVSWTTSNASIATVSPTGFITAVGYGVCCVTATTADGGFEAYTNVYVTAPLTMMGETPVTGITLSHSEITLVEGGAPMKLTATVSPPDATNKAVTWSVCSTAIITVDQTGLVTPVGAGSCIVTVTTQEARFRHFAS